MKKFFTLISGIVYRSLQVRFRLIKKRISTYKLLLTEVEVRWDKGHTEAAEDILIKIMQCKHVGTVLYIHEERRSAVKRAEFVGNRISCIDPNTKTSVVKYYCSEYACPNVTKMI